MINFTALASSSAGCCYIVTQDGQFPLMIDCGITMKAIRALTSVSRIADCLISHQHLDHCKAALDLIKAAVNIYASRPTLDTIKTDRPYKLWELADGWRRIGMWDVLPFGVEHDVDGALGFVVGPSNGTERLLYLTDSAYSRYRFENLTQIAIECNHSEEIIRQNVDAGIIDPARFARTSRTHFSLERVLAFLASCDLSKVTRIYLLHLSDLNSDAAAFKAASERQTGIPVTVCS